ncbi:MAG TPA: hypothetical protein DEG78_11985 [Rhodobacteraceae bacterium]|nr:hypothetical protein [Paracoccaceae bacterium]
MFQQGFGFCIAHQLVSSGFAGLLWPKAWGGVGPPTRRYICPAILSILGIVLRIYLQNSAAFFAQF